MDGGGGGGGGGAELLNIWEQQSCWIFGTVSPKIQFYSHAYMCRFFSYCSNLPRGCKDLTKLRPWDGGGGGAGGMTTNLQLKQKQTCPHLMPHSPTHHMIKSMHHCKFGQAQFHSTLERGPAPCKGRWQPCRIQQLWFHGAVLLPRCKNLAVCCSHFEVKTELL